MELLFQHTVGVLVFVFDVLNGSLVTMVKHYFIIHQILEVLLGQRVFLKVEIKEGHRLCDWLVRREVQLLQVLVSQCLLHGDSIIRIVGQHFLKQINCQWIGSLEQLLKLFRVPLGQLNHELLVLLVFNLIDQFGTGVAEEFCYHVKLLFLRAGGEQGLTDYELGEDAAYGPDVDGRRVLSP